MNTFKEGDIVVSLKDFPNCAMFFRNRDTWYKGQEFKVTHCGEVVFGVQPILNGVVTPNKDGFLESLWFDGKQRYFRLKPYKIFLGGE